ncbi:hypothetical protein KDL44_03245 [bacterium]|nr:hypothetical protein [bacterium]
MRFLLPACIAILFGLLLSACSGGAPTAPADPARAADSLKLSVLSDSFIGDSAAGGFSLESSLSGSELLVRIQVEQAQGLRALYYALEFDPAVLSPLTAHALPGFGDPGQTLQLLHAERGRVYAGQVLVHPEQQPGLNGNAAVAELRFALAAQPVQQRKASKINSSPGGSTPYLLSWDQDNTQLRWLYNNQADYDQNGEVNLADLTRLAQFFGQQQSGGFEIETAQSLVDGDGNGFINLADITPLGQNFLNSGNGGYRIYADSGSGGQEIATVPLSAGTGDTRSQRLQFSFAPPSPQPGNSYWPVLSDTAGNLGFAPPGEGPEAPLTIVLAEDDTPAQGSGTEADPYIIDLAGISASYTFAILDDGTDITGEPDVFIRAFDPQAALSIDQDTGEVQFNPAWTDTLFHLDGIAGSRVTDNRIYFIHSLPVEVLIELATEDIPAQGDGSAGNPYILNAGNIGQSFHFSVSAGGTDITGQPGCSISCSEAGALLSIDQLSGAVQFDPSFLDTQFQMQADWQGTASSNGIHFLHPAPGEGFFLLPDPSDPDWASVTGDGLTAETPLIISTPLFNTDGSVEFSFILNTRADGLGTSIPVDSPGLVWSAEFPFMVTNGWNPPGSATFQPAFTNTFLYVMDAELNSTNNVYVAATSV